jgi:thiol-disulfide isomerase/thioredoxin
MKSILVILFVLFSISASADVVRGTDLRSDKFVEINISDDKPTVYYFLSAWCPCSQGTFDHLNKLQQEYKQFKFIGFHSSVDIPKSDALGYFAKYKIDFPIILDDKVEYADKFKALKTPHIFVYGADGKVLFQGGATNSRNPKRAKKFYLKDALASISLGKEPKVKSAKAIGCYIQREK